MKDKFPSVFVESSGGVTENNIEQFMSPHVDVVSSSITTQGYSVVDFSLKIEKDGHNPENPLVNIGSTWLSCPQDKAQQTRRARLFWEWVKKSVPFRKQWTRLLLHLRWISGCKLKSRVLIRSLPSTSVWDQSPCIASRQTNEIDSAFWDQVKMRRVNERVKRLKVKIALPCVLFDFDLVSRVFGWRQRIENLVPTTSTKWLWN